MTDVETQDQNDIRTLVSLFENRAAHFTWCAFWKTKGLPEAEQAPCNCGQQDAREQVEAIYRRWFG